MSDLNALWAKLLDEGRVRWIPGMRGFDVGGKAFRVRQAPSGIRMIHEDADSLWQTSRSYPLIAPDWADPATLGCLLAMAIEVAEEHHVAGRFVESEDLRTTLRTATALWVGGAMMAAAEALLRAIEEAR